MSRYIGEINSAPILKAAEHWCAIALKKDGSVFSDSSLWSLTSVQELEKYYVKQVDEGERSFLEKLKDQLAPTTGEVRQLAAEMLWLMLLCPTNVSAETKKEQIRTVWGWSGDQLSADSMWLSPQTLAGVGSAGQSFNYSRWRELVFFINFMLAFKQLDANHRERLLADGRAFAEWLTQVPEEQSRQLRHMILFLLFPDNFERIFGGNDRREIVQRFTDKPKSEVDALPTLTIDRELQNIRHEQEAKYSTKDLDFYRPPLISIWKRRKFEDFTKDISREHVVQALEEIDRKGVPPDARSTTYDLIYGPRRYPPKLVLSVASRYGSGEEFDRGLFTGGETSPAFALLRRLGFYIERKPVVEELIRKFLAQAEAADDLSTSSYPKGYRGLQVTVSFGKGTSSKIPWISFLGPGQKTSAGIYPVYLFYRDVGVLVLAYGISETTAPAVIWEDTEGADTVHEFLRSGFGKTPERYGDSLVYSAYRVPEDIDGNRLTADLDRLIAKYEIQLGSAGPELPEPAATAAPLIEAPVSSPYTVDDALKGVFMDRDVFKGILDVWERKKNIILQGPPGVGKTFMCRRLAYALMLEDARDRVGAVQFHQTYAYEDFVQGYRPTPDGFERRDGLFHQFCERARDDQNRKYIFIIDEINRGNLSKIFGELMMLIEPDKRNAEWSVPLAYSLNPDDKFYVPENLYVIGLMNTADRSIAMVDYALRRRFAFVELSPAFDSAGFSAFMTEAGTDPGLLNKIIHRMTSLNDAINKDIANLGRGFCIGHSFFCDLPKAHPPDENWYKSVVQGEIAPLLREYWFDNSETADYWVNYLMAG